MPWFKLVSVENIVTMYRQTRQYPRLLIFTTRHVEEMLYTVQYMLDSFTIRE